MMQQHLHTDRLSVVCFWKSVCYRLHLLCSRASMTVFWCFILFNSTEMWCIWHNSHLWLFPGSVCVCSTLCVIAIYETLYLQESCGGFFFKCFCPEIWWMNDVFVTPKEIYSNWSQNSWIKIQIRKFIVEIWNQIISKNSTEPQTRIR